MISFAKVADFIVKTNISEVFFKRYRLFLIFFKKE